MAPPASRGGSAERAAVLVVLRRGSELLHIYDRDLAQRLMAPLGPSSASWPAEAVLPHLAGCAAAVGARAAELTALLGQPTLCKGLAVLRATGHRVPAKLERSMRAVDAAASLLRHPGAAEETMSQFKDWFASSFGARDARGTTKDTDLVTVSTAEKLVDSAEAEHMHATPRQQADDVLARPARHDVARRATEASVPCPPLQHRVSGSIATEPLQVGGLPHQHPSVAAPCQAAMEHVLRIAQPSVELGRPARHGAGLRASEESVGHVLRCSPMSAATPPQSHCCKWDHRSGGDVLQAGVHLHQQPCDAAARQAKMELALRNEQPSFFYAGSDDDRMDMPDNGATQRDYQKLAADVNMQLEQMRGHGVGFMNVVDDRVANNQHVQQSNLLEQQHLLQQQREQLQQLEQHLIEQHHQQQEQQKRIELLHQQLEKHCQFEWQHQQPERQRLPEQPHRQLEQQPLQTQQPGQHQQLEQLSQRGQHHQQLEQQAGAMPTRPPWANQVDGDMEGPSVAERASRGSYTAPSVADGGGPSVAHGEPVPRHPGTGDDGKALSCMPPPNETLLAEQDGSPDVCIVSSADPVGGADTGDPDTHRGGREDDLADLPVVGANSAKADTSDHDEGIFVHGDRESAASKADESVVLLHLPLVHDPLQCMKTACDGMQHYRPVQEHLTAGIDRAGALTNNATQSLGDDAEDLSDDHGLMEGSPAAHMDDAAEDLSDACRRHMQTVLEQQSDEVLQVILAVRLEQGMDTEHRHLTQGILEKRRNAAQVGDPKGDGLPKAQAPGKRLATCRQRDHKSVPTADVRRHARP